MSDVPVSVAAKVSVNENGLVTLMYITHVDFVIDRLSE